MQLAELYPEASLHGFDISPALYPPKETLPSNVHLGIMDIRNPPPVSEHSKFDVVHISLIAAGLTPSEWEPVVHNVTQLLKPGGAIQWAECDWAATQHLRSEVNSSVQTYRSMGTKFREAFKNQFSRGWNTLPQMYQAAGLKQIQQDIVSSDRLAETRKPLSRNGIQAIFGWAKLVSARNAPGALSLDEIARLEKEAERDIESGCYARFDIYIALGFKHDSL